MSDSDKRCGTVSIIGRPNAGKSTLLNTILGQKISIVSPKVQTTRSRITGIITDDMIQMILIDTPGLMQPRSRFERAMVSAAHESLGNVDVIVHLVDVSGRAGASADVELIRLFPANTPVFLALNKIDTLPRNKLLDITQAHNQAFDYAQTFMISALKDQGLDALVKSLRAAMPLGPWLYAEDQVTDLPMRMLASEITREKIFLQLHQELPYAAYVETESWTRDARGLLHISQVICVQRESQKAIVLGKKGARIREIGTAARQEIEKIIEEKINLKLFVKVNESWEEKSDLYAALGLDFKA